MPATALTEDLFNVTVEVGANGTITIGDEPQEGEDEARVYFRSDTENPNISIDTNEGGGGCDGLAFVAGWLHDGDSMLIHVFYFSTEYRNKFYKQ